MLEWYDFYLYATMAALIVWQVFFDTADPRSASLKAFAIGFIARPIGVIAVLIVAAIFVIVAGLYDQGNKFTDHKN